MANIYGCTLAGACSIGCTQGMKHRVPMKFNMQIYNAEAAYLWWELSLTLRHQDVSLLLCC